MNYNKKLLRTLEDRFDQVQAYLFRAFDGTDDLYSFIASIIYDKDYDDCCEWKDGKPNKEGKERRDRIKQCLLPIVAECGGISDPAEEDSENLFVKEMILPQITHCEEVLGKEATQEMLERAEKEDCVPACCNNCIYVSDCSLIGIAPWLTQCGRYYEYKLATTTESPNLSTGKEVEDEQD